MVWKIQSPISGRGKGCFFFLQTSGESVGCTEPPVYCVLGVLFMGLERLGCEVEC